VNISQPKLTSEKFNDDDDEDDDDDDNNNNGPYWVSVLKWFVLPKEMASNFCTF